MTSPTNQPLIYGTQLLNLIAFAIVNLISNLTYLNELLARNEAKIEYTDNMAHSNGGKATWRVKIFSYTVTIDASNEKLRICVVSSVGQLNILPEIHKNTNRLYSEYKFS